MPDRGGPVGRRRRQHPGALASGCTCWTPATTGTIRSNPRRRGNRFMRHARAKVLGGCSSHNSCIAFWPPAECLDEWVEMGAAGWSAAEVLPLVGDWRTTMHRAITATTARSACATSRRTIPAAPPCWRRRRWPGCRRWPSTAVRRCATAPAGSRSTPARTAPACRPRTPTCIPSSTPGTTSRCAPECWVSEILFDEAKIHPSHGHRGALPTPRPHGLRHRVRPARGHRHRWFDRHTEAVDALRNRARRASAGDRDPGAGRLAGRRVQSRRSRRGPGVLGGVEADGHDLHAVVGDRPVHHGRRGHWPSPT